MVIKLKKFYITTSIAYPNGRPHMGHALEIIQADTLARFYKLQDKNVFLQTGTDEHGVKNWQTAKKEKKEIRDFLNTNVAVFRGLYNLLNISYDSFIRTTNKKIHYPGAIKLWTELVKTGDIYKKEYKGKYCSGCESFKTKKELEKGKCIIHPTIKIDPIEEENYFFRLSKYKDKIAKIIKEDKYKVTPKSKKNEILSFLKEAKDISFSRPRTTLPWGIPVPEDDTQTMYVWCDALSNYITGVGYGIDNGQFNKTWPADIHIIGKDILRFHAAFWPAMLLSAKIPLPKELFVHGFVLSKGTKMSKSTGNVIDPFEQIAKYSVDPFRFYLLGAMPVEGDGDYTEKLVQERINSELVSNLSNFCYRVMSFANKNSDSKIKSIDNDLVIKKITSKFDVIKKAFEERNFKRAVDEVLAISALGNQYFQSKEPWKDPKNSQEVLGTCLNIVKNLSILIEPIIPESAKNLQKQLNVKNLRWKDLNFDLKNHKMGKAEILFRKYEQKEEIKTEKFKKGAKIC